MINGAWSCWADFRHRIKGPAPREGGILCRLGGSFQSKHFWINNHFPFCHVILIFSSCCEKQKKKETEKKKKMSKRKWPDGLRLEWTTIRVPWTDFDFHEGSHKKDISFHETKHLQKIQQQQISYPTWHILVRWTHDRWPACLSPGTWWRISSCPGPASGLNSSCHLVCLWQVNTTWYWASGYKKTQRYLPVIVICSAHIHLLCWRRIVSEEARNLLSCTSLRLILFWMLNLFLHLLAQCHVQAPNKVKFQTTAQLNKTYKEWYLWLLILFSQRPLLNNIRQTKQQ